jgi:hypothetical protein
MKKPISTADLASKTCKRGHTGQYVMRKGGSSACKACVRSSMLRYRGVEEAKLGRLKEASTQRLAELTTTIAKLRLELELSEAEHDFLSKRLALLSATK